MKLTKRTKSSRMHGRNRGSHGWGARKKHKKSGHKGGKGMSGSGKRADQKKTLVTKLYGHKYFGKQGITSKGTKKDKRKRINLQQIEFSLEKYGKKIGDKWEINLKDYKILGTGEVKNKLIIKANDSSKSAREKVKSKGGEIILICLSKHGQTKAKQAPKSTIKKVEKAGGESHSLNSFPKSQTKAGSEIILSLKKENKNGS
ncbi:MAG: uL15 family ribosomal protein [Nanoarchaeota archaeon]|nr:uL15 family ribosomal protein [Nanoarchaeota archaeon]MBU1028291.1 uL15 family ribosomal protein [Nanoarchaeota archaeon]